MTVKPVRKLEIVQRRQRVAEAPGEYRRETLRHAQSDRVEPGDGQFVNSGIWRQRHDQRQRPRPERFRKFS